MSEARSAFSEDGRRVVAQFVDQTGRLHTMPTKRNKRLVVLDLIAQSFELGRTYPEAEVDVILKRFHADHAALRRYLVEEQFLTREDGWYWRSGGSVEL